MTNDDLGRSGPEVRLLTTRWTTAARPVAAVGDHGRLLVLATDDRLVPLLREALRQRDETAPPEVVESAPRLLEALRNGPRPERILIHRGAAAGPPDPDTAEREYLLLQQVTQVLMGRRSPGPVRLVYAFAEPAGEVLPHYAAASAFARVVALEQPAFRYRAVAVRRPSDSLAALTGEVAALLDEFDAADDAVAVRHDGGQRQVRSLGELAAPPPGLPPAPVSAGGVYLITGGLGGLGSIIATDLSRRAPVRLVLTGRRQLDDAGRRLIADLEQRGARACYVPADIADPDGVGEVIAQAKARYGAVNGVVHSAGMVRDGLLLTKTPEEATGVLAAKARGAVLLDAALGDQELDFFVLFSSLAGTLGNVGQADYGFANGFLDHFSHWREEQRRQGLRHGRTVSIAWPLWADSPMADRRSAEQARIELGLHPLPADEGVAALYRSLAAVEPHVVVVKGDPRTWPVLLGAPSRQERTAEPQPAPEPVDPALRRRTTAYVVGLVSRYTKLPRTEIRTDVSFGRYGLESVVVVTIIQNMERDLGSLSKTLLFEYDSIDEVAGHLMATKAQRLRALFGLEPPRAAAPAAPRGRPSPARSGKWALLTAKREAEKPVADRNDHTEYDGIAVIGVAGRYPSAGDLGAFWENLSHARDAVTEVPAQRWDHSLFYDEERGRPGKTYSRWGGFLDGVERFDPLFFNISPAEAEFLDPQERLFLETVWQAIEDAGYPSSALAGRKIGVFTGVMFGLYQLLATDKHGGWVNGNSSYASVANRVSHFFDFHGPSMTVDTMCSSSLVAVHQACASIRSGESELAVAGGVNIMTHPAKYVQLSQGHFLSSDGRCRSFGADGDGYVPGEGVGAVLLKSLRQARADGDRIHAVIAGSAVNAGGRTSGYSVPSPQAQAAVITDALDRAGVDPRTISYVEAHGTGTALGDPIEITGLTTAYRRSTQDSQFCAIGSVKSNIGHLESAAGIAALTKVILQMRHGRLAPSLHATPGNPLIDFAETPFFVQRELAEWKRPTLPDGRTVPRRAAISAFGAGGTNAHLIVQEPPEDGPPVAEAAVAMPFPVSAHTEQALTGRVRQLLEFLDRHTRPTRAGEAPPTAGADHARAEIRAAVASSLGVPPTEIDDDEAFPDQGLDAYGFARAADLARIRLGAEVSPELLQENPTVNRAAQVLTADPVPSDRDSTPVLDLAGLAATLQTGRDPMAQRLVVVAATVDDLRLGLTAYLDQDTGRAGLHQGRVASGDRRIHTLLTHEMTRSYTRQLLTDGGLDEAADLWVMGAEVDWSVLWTDRRPRRVSLPAFAFDRDVHWIVPLAPGDPLVPASAAFGSAPAATPAVPPAPLAPAAVVAGEDAVLADLKRCFGQVLKIPASRLRPEVHFEDFGLDSVRVTGIHRMLEQEYGELPKSLLFSYRTLESLAGHLATRLPQRPRSGPAPVAPPVGGVPDDRADIAIIGISGRYPQAPTLRDFEANLLAGRDSITEIPGERWDHREYPDIKCRWGGFLDDALSFDPSFFGLSPNAAAYMDPQERLFVQSVWHSIEDAGYRPETLTRSGAQDGRLDVAVFAGVSFNEYGLYGAADLAAGQDAPIDSQLYSVANRISYLLNLRGPSLVVDTACSSSLYALHLGCEALRNGTSDIAVAGGVNLSLHPSKYLTLDMFNFLAPDGHCKAFGAGGNGYVPGEGVGAVVLKPLAAAERDGDHIYGVIRGSAVNHGGRTNGYTVPNPVAQAEVIGNALTTAGLAPGDISYLEAHGTGTSLGDAIEIEALTEAFAGYPADGPRCAIGSVKSNIGHLEAAAGVSALTKVVLQMRSGRLFPSRLNTDRLNPDIDFSTTPFRVQLEATPWTQAPPAPDGRAVPRRAGISSFGVGGVNVHLVIEEYVPTPRRSGAGGVHLIPLSARTPEALTRYAGQLHEALCEEPRPALADMAFTLQTGRRQLRHRVAFVVADHEELSRQLAAFIASDQPDGVHAGDAGPEAGASGDDPGPRPVSRDEWTAFARRWVVTAGTAFDAWYTDRPGARVPLPGYPFEKERYWLYREQVRPARPAAPVVVPEPVLAEPAPPTETTDGRDRAFLLRLAEAFDDEHLDLVVRHVQGEMGQVLGFADDRLPEADRGFFDLGIDSITASQAHSRLEQAYGVELDLQLFFNYPTVNDVAAYILSLLDIDALPAADEVVPVPEAGEPVDTWLLGREWADSPEAAPEAAPVTGGVVLLLDTDESLASELAAMDGASAPERVVVVRPGTGFRCTGTDRYEVDPVERADFAALFAALTDRGLSVDRIIHRWSGPGPATLESDLDRGIHAMTALSQALAGRRGAPIHLLYAFTDHGGVASPENRGIGGFARAVRMDNPTLVFRAVEFTGTDPRPGRMARLLMAEFGQADREPEVRYDGDRRQVRVVRPVPAGQPVRARFRAGGAFLVTGGLGGLAAIVAGHLCREYRARVVLVGRREVDQAALDELRSGCPAGSEIVYARADVGDRDQVARLVQDARMRFGAISGVIHAAGVLRDSSIADKSRADVDEVLRAKVLGTRYLDEELVGEPIECFVVFSTLSAVLGNFGQTDTCFAGGYVDAFAEYREALRSRGERHGHTVAVNWSLWRDGKLTVPDGVLAMMRSRMGMAPIEADEGCRALEICTGLDRSQVVVVKGEPDRIATVFGMSGVAMASALRLGDPAEAVSDDGPGGTDLRWIDEVADPRTGDTAAPVALDAMSEEELAALLEREIELSMSAADGMA